MKSDVWLWGPTSLSHRSHSDPYYFTSPRSCMVGTHTHSIRLYRVVVCWTASSWYGAVDLLLFWDMVLFITVISINNSLPWIAVEWGTQNKIEGDKIQKIRARKYKPSFLILVREIVSSRMDINLALSKSDSHSFFHYYIILWPHTMDLFCNCKHPFNKA
jgi:hypothetical protein